MRKEPMCKVCNDNLAPGQKCSSCGGYRQTETESARILLSAQQPPFDAVKYKFEGNVKELTAMIDIRFRVNYPCKNEAKTAEMVNRIRNGELPSQLVLET